MHSLPRVETLTTTRGHGRKNEDFVCIYEVYNCIPSPVFCTPEKPNRKWYQTLTTPQNCIISPLSNKATFKCTACLGSKLWPRLGVMVGKTKISYVYTKFITAFRHLFSVPQKNQTGSGIKLSLHHKIVSSLLSLIKLHSSAQLA